MKITHPKMYVLAMVGGFIGGAALLGIFATIQKVVMHYTLTPAGYLAPILFGGISGAIIAFQYTRLKTNTINLQARHTFLTDILDTIPLFIWSSTVNGDGEETIIFRSRAIKEIAGYPPEVFQQNHHWLDIVHPDDRARVMEKISLNHQGKSQDIEYRIIHADGSVRWVRSIATPITDAAGKVVRMTGSVEDITDRKQMDARYRGLFENTPIGLWEEDHSAGKARLDALRAAGITDFEQYFAAHPEEMAQIAAQVKVLNVNRAAMEMHQAPSKEALMAGLPQIFGADSLETFKKNTLAMYNGNTNFCTEATVYTLTGEPRHITICVSIPPGAEDTWERVFVSTIDITERVEAEKQLAQTMDSFAKAQAIAHIGNWDWNIITNKLIWSDEIYRIFGLPPHAFNATYPAFLEAVHPDDRQAVTDAVNISLADPDVQYHVRHRVVRPDGTVRMVEEVGDVIRNTDGNPIRMIGTVRDITDRHTAETALRQSEERYRNLIDNSPVGIVILRDKKIAYINPTLAKMLGYTPDELIGKPMLPLIHPDFRETAKVRLGKLMRAANTRVNAQEEKMLCKDGSVIDTLILGQSINYDGELAIQGYIYDITEQNQMRQALEESETRYQQLVEFLPQAVVVHVDGKIKYANPSALKLAGVDSLVDILDTPLLNFVHPDDREYAAGRIRQLLVEKKPTTLSEIRIIRADGNIIYGETSGHPITFQGQDAGLSIITDISERKQLETQLRQSQKMEAIGRLAGGVAHDFNNLLTAIMGYTALLEQQIPEKGDAAHDLHEIKKATNRAADLVRQLLAFSRQQIVQPRLWRLNDSINNIKKMLQRLIGEDIELHTFLPESLGYVKIDPGHVEQIIMNLAVNARDAMPSGGDLTIETANVYLDEEYSRHHAEVIPGEYVLLAISDTGHGISPQAMEHIFEPFFTTKEVGKGTGLGLATVHGIVKQNKGHIGVYSEVSHGTTFKIYFPRVHTPSEPDYTRQLAPNKLPSMRGTETILLVEDETAVRELTHKLLTELGYTVLFAANGEAALAQVMAAKPHLDLLLTDVVITGKVSGRTLADAVQKISPDTRILYMSGYTDNVIVHHHILDPGLNFIQKPFSPIELARAVRKVLDHSPERIDSQ